jgi:RNA polymerase sigma-70 factor, ECF subfamily
VAIDDGALWARTRAGDADAYGVLFDRYAKMVYNYCFRRTGDWTVAEELVSIVFLEVWRRRDKELGAEKVLPWLYGVANNVVRNRRRAERRFAAALRRLPAPQPEADFAGDADERLDDERRMQHALRLVAALPQHEQDVFILCAWTGFSYDDAAVTLEIPVGTVRSRLSRARTHLREHGNASGHDEETEHVRPEALSND